MAQCSSPRVDRYGRDGARASAGDPGGGWLWWWVLREVSVQAVTIPESS